MSLKEIFEWIEILLTTVRLPLMNGIISNNAYRLTISVIKCNYLWLCGVLQSQIHICKLVYQIYLSGASLKTFKNICDSICWKSKRNIFLFQS